MTLVNRRETSTCLGLDIGGANLKAADGRGTAISEPFPMWRESSQLAERLTRLIAKFPHCRSFAATMTGELADCFATKAEGVDWITRALESAASGRPVKIWSNHGEFVSPAEARSEPFDVAAANWHALATWVGKQFPRQDSLLIDIGSTTTDLIPIFNGEPATEEFTDVGRLLYGELIYTGVRRTPVCAVPGILMLRGRRLTLAAELFATMLDVYLIRRLIPEDPTCCETADGRPATIPAAINRLARAACCDSTELRPFEIQELANQLWFCQQEQLNVAVKSMVDRFEGRLKTVITSGIGSFLARDIFETIPLKPQPKVISLDALLSPTIAECAPAYALAMLSGE